MKILKKYFWQILSVTLGLIAIFATYNVYYLGKPRKEISIIAENLVPLVEVREEAIPDIQVFYRDEPVSNLYLYQLKIENTGNQPISEEDYSQPISFSFPKSFQIVDISITDTQPRNIGMEIIKLSENEAVASKSLLNPDDIVSIKIILIGIDNNITEDILLVDGRIKGVKGINKIVAEKNNSSLSTPLLIGVFMGGAISIFTLLFEFIFSKIDKIRKLLSQENKKK